VTTEVPSSPRPRGSRRGWAWPALLAAGFATFPAPARAASQTLTQDDVSLALYVSQDGSTWSALTGNTLSGFFGGHECACPDTLAVQVELTTTGQANLGSSVVDATYLLGNDCANTPAGCKALGQNSISTNQTTTPPTFSSSFIYQAATGSSVPSCTGLTAGATTLWATLAQDGVALPFALSLTLPVIGGTVGAPGGVTVAPANQGLLVSWKAPAIMNLVAGFQVLCSPGPASPGRAGYETCGLATTASVPSPVDATQVCSDVLPSTTTSTRISGLVNGTLYTVGVIAIDPSGGTSAMSPSAQGTPQTTLGFYEKYRQDGGAAEGCSLAGSPAAPGRGHGGPIVIAAALFLLFVRRRLGHPRRSGGALTRSSLALLLALSLVSLFLAESPARAQVASFDGGSDWAANPSPSTGLTPTAWTFEIGLSLYRPAVDRELGGAAHPYADTFGNSRHLLSIIELDRYLVERAGAWGVGLRAGYYKVSAGAFLADGSGRSGDETALKLFPFALSLVYRASNVPGLRRAWLTPYGKAGFDGVWWSATNTGDTTSHHGLTLGWHGTVGLMFGFGWVNHGEPHPGVLADPCALFFEWSYAAIDGLGQSHALHVGDNTGIVGIVFDL
jgi:hypothetical protein